MSEILYSQRPDWQDITPVYHVDDSNSLVSIDYNSDYSDALNYFRAITLKNEISERALELTSHIISINPAHYTVWNYRQKVLFGLNSDLEEEIRYINEIAQDQSKNFQIWHHRQVVVERLNKPDQEIAFIDSVLDNDAKNYHGWAYRQWVVRHFGLWDQELTFTNDMLVFDIRNNSAWNHRHFVLFNRPNTPTKAEIEEEIEFVKKQILLVPHNSSPWSYLKGLFEKTKKRLCELEGFLKEVIETKGNSKFVLSMYVDLFEENSKLDQTKVDPIALELCKELAERQDTIRERYWNFRAQKLIK